MKLIILILYLTSLFIFIHFFVAFIFLLVGAERLHLLLTYSDGQIGRHTWFAAFSCR